MSKKVILVCEDERPLAEAITKKLEKNGFEVVTSRTVTQALRYLEEGVRIDGIWLDHYLLGKEDGLDLVAKIKEDTSAWKNVPIFVVSNTATAEKVHSYMKLGVKNYYTKADFKLEQIIADIKNHFEEEKK
jgi:DNA-binding response OmpR family regulator